MQGATKEQFNHALRLSEVTDEDSSTCQALRLVVSLCCCLQGVAEPMRSAAGLSDLEDQMQVLTELHWASGSADTAEGDLEMQVYCVTQHSLWLPS